MRMTLTDLFVVGLALDIAGAILLAKGLLLDSKAIRGLGTWGGIGFGATVERCRDRVDAETIGVTAIVVPGCRISLVPRWNR